LAGLSGAQELRDLNPTLKRVYLAGGETLDYDKVLIATGAEANTFPVEGLDET
jgi:NADH dehydrogenase FAD-containing subunit